MMRFVTAASLAVWLLPASCYSRLDTRVDAPLRADTSHSLVVSDSDIAHLGMETQPATAATYEPQVHGFGVVLNASTLAQADADILSAQAAVLLSRANLERMHALGSSHAISMQTVDVATHQATADEVQLALSDRREVALFGTDAPWRGSPRNADIVSR